MRLVEASQDFYKHQRCLYDRALQSLLAKLFAYILKARCTIYFLREHIYELDQLLVKQRLDLYVFIALGYGVLESQINTLSTHHKTEMLNRVLLQKSQALIIVPWQHVCER